MVITSDVWGWFNRQDFMTKKRGGDPQHFHPRNLREMENLRLFQRTELEHTPSNLYQQAIKGFLS